MDSPTNISLEQPDGRFVYIRLPVSAPWVVTHGLPASVCSGCGYWRPKCTCRAED
jgi:hypothetical protein